MRKENVGARPLATRSSWNELGALGEIGQDITGHSVRPAARGDCRKGECAKSVARCHRLPPTICPLRRMLRPLRRREKKLGPRARRHQKVAGRVVVLRPRPIRSFECPFLRALRHQTLSLSFDPRKHRAGNTESSFTLRKRDGAALIVESAGARQRDGATAYAMKATTTCRHWRVDSRCDPSRHPLPRPGAAFPSDEPG